MTDARGRGIGHFVFACCCTWRKPDSVKRQTAVDGRSDRGDASPPDRTLRMNTGWPSSPSSTGKQSSVRCSEFHARHFATSMLGPDILSGHTLPPGDEDVGNHHPTGIAIQKLDERRAYLVFLHRNLSARRQDVKQIQWHQWFAANGLEAPALHGMRFDRSSLAIATAAESLSVARLDDRFAPAVSGRPIIALPRIEAPRKVLLRQFAAKPSTRLSKTCPPLTPQRVQLSLLTLVVVRFSSISWCTQRAHVAL